MLDFTLGGIQFQQDRMPEALENYRTRRDEVPELPPRLAQPRARVRARGHTTTRSARSRA
jgi:hypothetical protein